LESTSILSFCFYRLHTALLLLLLLLLSRVVYMATDDCYDQL